jgi:hypothetical protein
MGHDRLPGYRVADDPHDPPQLHRLSWPEELQQWQDERDEARIVTSLRATLIRAAALIGLVLLSLWVW